MNWYTKVVKNFLVFEGRASRQEYWMFVLFNIIISIGIAILGTMLSKVTNTNQTILSNIYSIVMILPNISVAIRRMHDTGHSGWWSIVPIAGLVFACQAGHPEENQYGRNPNKERL